MKFYQILLLVFVVVFTSCVKNNKDQQVTNQTPTNEKAFEVKEVVQTSNYTYMKVNENFADRWVAVSRMDAVAGEKYYYDDALLMNNFHSKELDRDFETIYFINKVSSIPFSMQEKMNSMPSNHSGNTSAKQKSSVSLEKEDDEITVAQVFENRSKYAYQEIEIRGMASLILKLLHLSEHKVKI